ncbi:unnamed protein product [Haemonchus placei]|uniref:Chitin-binding type-2 domain-containing protein n=1 Tax=Haemonchus placei TaxID=6290 RepID=A0A0N4WGK4_HAEPC|nr:unnamed protein product [Haemonchus placei]
MFRLILLTLLSYALAKPYQQAGTNFCADKQPGLFANGCSSNVTVCNKFGNEIWLLCPFELIFDESVDECMDPRLVSACSGTTPTPQGPVRDVQGLPDRLCEGSTDGYHSATGCSTSVVQCVGGVSRLLECSEGEVFDNAKQGCVPPAEMPACKAAFETQPTTAPSSGAAEPSGPSSSGVAEPSGPSSSGTAEPSGPSSSGAAEPSGPSSSGAAEPTTAPTSGAADSSSPASSGAANECEGLADGFFEKEPCSSFFLTCSGGVSRILTCPASLVFDRKLSVCEYPENVEGCGSQGGEGPSGGAEICSKDGYFSYGNCSDLFYACSNGRQIPMYCPAKLAFDETRQLCDYPLAVAVCTEQGSGEGSGESSGESSGEGSGEGSGEASGEHSGEFSGEASGEYSGEGSAGSGNLGATPVPLNTVMYSDQVVQYDEYSSESYVAFNEGVVEGSAEASGEPSGALKNHPNRGDKAPGGLSSKASRTDEASGEPSGNVGQEAPGSKTPEVQQTWDGSLDVPSESTTPASETAMALCKGKDDGFYASGCSSEAIACKAGQATSMLCPAHMLFDEHKRMCDYPENVPCYGTGEVDGVQQRKCTVEGPVGTGPCSRVFMNCVEGKAFQLACDDGYVFSVVHRSCAEASKVQECTPAQSPTTEVEKPPMTEQPVPQPEQPVPQPEQPVPQTQQPVPQPQQPVPQPEQPVPQPEQPVPQPEQPVPQPEQPVPQPEQPAADDKKAKPMGHPKPWGPPPPNPWGPPPKPWGPPPPKPWGPPPKPWVPSGEKPVAPPAKGNVETKPGSY